MKYHQKGQKLGKIFFSEYYYMCKLLFNAGIPMTISWWSPETKKTSRVDQYTEGVDNVENLKGQLSTLKKEIKGSEVPVSPTENIDFGKNKEGQDILQTWDAFITEMDKDVEEIFDEYVKINESRIKELLRKWQSGQDELEKEFDTKIRNKALIGFEHYKNILDANAIKQFKFELTPLKDEIVNMIKAEGIEEEGWTPDNPFNTTGEESTVEQQKEIEKGYNMQKDNVEAYPGFGSYDVSDEYEIENIYKDNKIVKVMERIFDNEEQKELKKWTFRVNLWLEKGLAGMIVDIRNAVEYKAKYGDIDDEDTHYNEKYEQIYYGLKELNVDDDWNISFSDDNKKIKEQIKKLVKDGFLSYEHEWGIDAELGKIAKIFARAQWNDLDTFASLLQNKPDVSEAIKERNNALEVTGQSREDKDEFESSLINETNVFEFLCDFNSDGVVSAAYYKRDKKGQKGEPEQKNQGDVWPLFGQQVMRTIDQAIEVKTVELGGDPDKSTLLWEQVVIQNIIRNMNIYDKSFSLPRQKEFVENMLNDTTQCTKENLAKLINGYTEDGTVYTGMPELRMYFLDAIETMNGGSEVMQPDLYNTLVGDELDELLEIENENLKMKESIDAFLKKIQDMKDENYEQYKDLIELIRTQWAVKVRETIFTSIMKAMNGITITTNDGKATTNFQSAGISKYVDIRWTKKAIMDETNKILAGWGIHFSKAQWLRVELGIWQTGESKTHRTKWNRWASTGLNFWTAGGATWGGVSLYIELGGEVAEQYNYKRVINADLSQVKSAKYFWLEGGAAARISITDPTQSGAEIYGGINRQKDLQAGIEQIDIQYQKVSSWIFDIGDLSPDKLSDADAFRANIQAKIDNPAKESHQKFIENNKGHLTADLDTIIDYMQTNNFFWPGGKIESIPENKRKVAINSLLDIMQSGSIVQWRQDVQSGLHGRVSLSKLSLGITSNFFSLNIKKKTNTDNLEGNTQEWFNRDNEDIPVSGSGKEAANEMALGDMRLSLFGIYIGARISTRVNTYVPNEMQYLFTEYEISNGIWANQLEHLRDEEKDLKKQADYLEALYNDARLTCVVTSDDKIKITFTPKKEGAQTLREFLNLHATQDVIDNKTYALTDTELLIGNVWPIGAYTVTEAKGIRRILCLWAKELDTAYRVVENTSNTSVESIESKQTGYHEFSQTQIQDRVINTMNGTWDNLPEAKTTVAKFISNDGTITIPADLSGQVTLDPSDIEGKTLTTGTLEITKLEAGGYEIALNDQSPADKLVIRYYDETEFNEALKKAREEAKNNPDMRTTQEEVLDATNTLFSFEGDLLSAQKELRVLMDDLKELENKNPNTYSQFLLDASYVSNADGTIDDEEVAKAIEHLGSLLGKDKKFDTLKTYLEGTDEYMKAYIVDRFKQILAKEPLYEKMKIWAILNMHAWWERITWPSKQWLPSALRQELQQKRKDIYTAYKWDMYDTDPDIAENLIGYTAFYRQGITHAYSMTALGETSYQGSIETISEHEDLAQEWFLENFTKNQYEVEQLATSLEAKCKKLGFTVKLKDNEYTKTWENIEKLIKWDSITIDSWEEISIELDWVFYLLGDCCNESLGMNIKKITIKKLKDITVLDGAYTWEGIPDKIYEYGTTIYGSSESIASDLVSRQLGTSIKYYPRDNLKEMESKIKSWFNKKDQHDIPPPLYNIPPDEHPK